jgi:hypothetical protein
MHAAVFVWVQKLAFFQLLRYQIKRSTLLRTVVLFYILYMWASLLFEVSVMFRKEQYCVCLMRKYLKLEQ